MRKIIAICCLTCAFLSTGVSALFAADETIIPGRLSWSVDSIDEIWTVDVSETSLLKTSNFMAEGSYSETNNTENKGTSINSEHNFEAGIGANINTQAEMHAKVDAGIEGWFPWSSASAGASASASVGIGAYARYDYSRNRKYWQSTDRTTTTGFMERKIRTETTETSSEEKRYNRRLRVNVNFFNYGEELLRFPTTGRINLYFGGKPLGYASPTLREDTYIATEAEPCLSEFEMMLNDSQKIRDFDKAKMSELTVADVAKGQLKIVQVGKENETSIIRNSRAPFTIVVIHPVGMREWDIRPVKNEPCTFEIALNSISTHCQSDKKCRSDSDKEESRLPFEFSNGNLTVDGTPIPLAPRPDSLYFVAILDENGTPLNGGAEFLQLEPQIGKVYYFCILDRDILFHPWKWNTDIIARDVLVKNLPQLVKWRDDKVLDLKYLDLLAAETPEQYFQTLSNLSDEEARIMLGWCHYYGVGTAKNEEKALEIWKNVAESGSEVATGFVKEAQAEAERLAIPGRRMEKTIDGVKYAFRWCPAGSFQMGSGYDAHTVTLTQGFWMLETEVTQAMWESVMGVNPSSFEGDQLPVENVSWNDCQDFCAKLRLKGLEVSLPTEAQWEYACRAGTTGDYAGNLDEMAWYDSNSDDETHEVGLKKPNAWGLYDMHGNVWEWCADWYDSGYYSKSPASDPTGPATGSNRVARGGSWGLVAEYCRSAYRSYGSPDLRNCSLGVSLVLAVSSSER